MWRQPIDPRPDWQQIVESQGLLFHTPDGIPYWEESAYYQFTPGEIDELEKATYQLNELCLAAVERVIAGDLFDRFAIREDFRDYIRQSWETDEHTIYGRFDLAYDGQSPPKLLEYNADTPTSLLEAAVIQWFWLQDCFGGNQQFNSIHDRLLEIFKTLKEQTAERFYFIALDENVEDAMTVNYLRDVAMQSGFDTAFLPIEQVGWDARRQEFTDLDDRPIRLCFKLYPWEWMHREKFGPFLLESKCRWFEPPWKILLSNKAILQVLWELNPGHPLLLETSFEPPAFGQYVQKPLLGREGANIRIFDNGKEIATTEGPYDGTAVYQKFTPLPRFDDRFFAVVGSWIINGWSAGLGIREDESLITGNLSRFVPHLYHAEG